jgi:xanthine dehydrogenase iron-sulfur cluster and FAD-binding subunit A
VDEAAETIAAEEIGAGRDLDLCRFGLSKREPAVRALAIVILDVDPQDVFEVAPAEDQEPVETLVADGADESLRVGVRLRCLHGVLARVKQGKRK